MDARGISGTPFQLVATYSTNAGGNVLQLILPLKFSHLLRPFNEYAKRKLHNFTEQSECKRTFDGCSVCSTENRQNINY
uniref:Uncharacterized protein n=1 Tax=Schistosoma mansoni TaxID=6183 RepID=A0A5K4FCW6_SCHMA